MAGAGGGGPAGSIPDMRTRLLALAAATLLTTGCASAMEAVVPRYFYGNLAEAPGEELCLADPRDDEPERTRCFALGDAAAPADARPGDLLAVRYRLAEDERQEVIEVRVVERRD